ncbi:MAG: glycosyltransferase [Candidatus Bipolaricaulia bacterium]
MRGTAMPAPQGSSIPNAPYIYYDSWGAKSQGEPSARRAEELIKENQRLQTLLGAVEQELARLREANASLRQKLAEKNQLLQAQLAATEREVAKIREENVALVAALERDLSKIQEENTVLRQKLAVAEEKSAQPKTGLKVAAVIPARNEDRSIAPCLESLANQTYPLERIIVVNDGSTDWTELVVHHLRQRYPQIECINKKPDRSLRAGAVNKALKLLYESDCDLVLVADADAVFAPTVVEEAVKKFEQDKDEEIGGMCSSVELVGQGLLHRLQKLEYGGFNADRVATWRNIMIIHGLCGVYRLKALHEVGGYTVGHLIEDYDLTVKLKEAGWKTVFNPRMHVQTHSVPTLRALVRQRLRWYRGGVQVLLDHGINRFTAFDAFNHIHFIMLLAIIGLIVGFWLHAAGKWSPRFWWHPIPLALFALGWIEGLWQLRWVKGLDWGDVMIRVSLIPELVYYSFLSLLRVYAYFLEFISAGKRW